MSFDDAELHSFVPCGVPLVSTPLFFFHRGGPCLHVLHNGVPEPFPIMEALPWYGIPPGWCNMSTEPGALLGECREAVSLLYGKVEGGTEGGNGWVVGL